jgi:DNA-binding NarL/FixJ family response regulator
LLEKDEDLSILGEAGDGAETIARLSEAAADVLVLDVRMPRKGGVDWVVT